MYSPRKSVETVEDFTPSCPNMVKQNKKFAEVLAGIPGVERLTEDGRKWLISALDPFHDTFVERVGYPDLESANSVVYEYNSSFTVVAPGAGNWDCNIMSIPDLFTGRTTHSTELFTSTAGAQLVFAPSPINSWFLNSNYGPIMAVSVPTGAPTFPNVATAITNPTFTGSSPTSFLTLPGSIRVVGMGFEVTNSSAEIGQQGMACYYRVPQDCNSVIMNCTDGEDGLGSQLIKQSRSPPTLYSEAVTYPQSVEVPASDGAYIPVTMFSSANPPSEPVACARYYRYNQSLLTANTPASGTVGFGQCSTVVLDVTGGAAGGSTYLFQPIPYDTCGVYFTGLAGSDAAYPTTLQVKAKIILQRFPSPNDKLSVALSKRSPPYDPFALEVYSRIVQFLPPGCPVADNPAGEWWDTIVGIAQQVLPTLAAAIPHPVAKGVITSLNTGLGLIDGIKKSRKPPPPPPKPVVQPTSQSVSPAQLTKAKAKLIQGQAKK